MDATAMAAVRGLTAPRTEAVILPLLFGGFQAGMAGVGWGLGAWGGRFIEPWDHWIAFALLVGVGLKMLVDAWRSRGGIEAPQRSGAWVLIGLAVATSIDAAAAGITLPLIPVSPWIALALIGGVTTACSAIGFVVGRSAGRWLGGKLTALGGVILIAIGVRLLLQHL
ncbi:MAG: manganese efflux pump [Deltaproteobacteria bacterium]|nr:manganese efflux pump [Deltaproteobacteria bacterium]